MSASLSDILTALKNGVVALGDNSRFTQIIANLLSIAGGITRISQATMTTGYVAVYTCPVGQRAAVVDMNICNTTGSPIGIYINMVPNGATPTASNAIFFNASLPAYSTMQWTGSIAMTQGDTIQIKASATGCTFTASGGSLA